VEKDIPLKTTLEVARQKKACEIAGKTLYMLSGKLCPGITTRHIDEICRDFVEAHDARPSLYGYRNYPGNTCTSVNNVAAHGLPSDYSLREGDLITVDLTVEVDGWHGDSAWTFAVGEIDEDSRRLLRAAWNATMKAIAVAKAGVRMGDIGDIIARTAKRYGCSILDSFVGHGIGHDMHEEPMVLNSGEPGTGIPIVPGMVITVEPILCLGAPDVQVLDDGWTIVTRDSSRCAQFEHTIAIFSNRTETLTNVIGEETLLLDFPPFV
jgi:methionyl aminopeptidase